MNKEIKTWAYFVIETVGWILFIAIMATCFYTNL